MVGEERVRRDLVVIGLVVALQCAFVYCAPATVVSVLPNPVTEPRKCGLSSPSRVCDPDRFLSDTAINDINLWIDRIGTEARADCSPEKEGYQAAVLVLRTMVGYTPSVSTPLHDAQTLATAAMDSWGVGHAGCNDGIVLLVSISERVVYVSTGASTKKVLTELAVDTVLDLMIPHLKKQQYDNAVDVGVQAIYKILTGELKPTHPTLNMFIGAFWFIVVSLFIVALISSCTRSSSYTRCRSQLQRIEQDRAAALLQPKTSSDVCYPTTSCPICLEDFTTRTITLVLPCGHKFCKTCLSAWENQSSTCPVCRADFSSSSLSSVDKEVVFRLNSINRLYPQYVPRTMLIAWTSNPRGTFSTDTAFVSRNPSKSTSSSRLFGGGSSAGSGGHGRSW
ncbi:Dynein heavy chain 12, axonemal [Pelomyxa schiedti]|nr:Dynein heavy chain 12, axonemal [Pelomyxa schiedti]